MGEGLTLLGNKVFQGAVSMLSTFSLTGAGTAASTWAVTGLVSSLLGTATTAGGAKALNLGASGPHIYVGSGVPTISAVQGSLYMRTDGGASTELYVNRDGATSWKAVTTAA